MLILKYYEVCVAFFLISCMLCYFFSMEKKWNEENDLASLRIRFIYLKCWRLTWHDAMIATKAIATRNLILLRDAMIATTEKLFIITSIYIDNVIRQRYPWKRNTWCHTSCFFFLHEKNETSALATVKEKHQHCNTSDAHDAWFSCLAIRSMRISNKKKNAMIMLRMPCDFYAIFFFWRKKKWHGRHAILLACFFFSEEKNGMSMIASKLWKKSKKSQASNMKKRHGMAYIGNTPLPL